MATHTLTFRFDKETKGTWRLAEESDTPVVGSLYLQKDQVPERPETATVTIDIG